MKLLSITIILSLIFSCSNPKAKEDINPDIAKVDTITKAVKMDTVAIEQIPVFKIYGELAPKGYLDEANPITEEFGFRLERIAGCEVEGTLANEVDEENKAALDIMNKKYGEDWRQVFEQKTTYKLAIPFR